MSDKGQRVVIITGGSQGIGASLVTACPPGCLLVNSAVENAASDPEVAAWSGAPGATRALLH
jgi:hypothetical protein